MEQNSSVIPDCDNAAGERRVRAGVVEKTAKRGTGKVPLLELDSNRMEGIEKP